MKSLVRRTASKLNVALLEPLRAQPGLGYFSDLSDDAVARTKLLLASGLSKGVSIDPAMLAVTVLDRIKQTIPHELEPVLDGVRVVARPLRSLLERQIKRSPASGRVESDQDEIASAAPAKVGVVAPIALSVRPSLDVVVCVHNALEDVQACLAALESTSEWFDRIVLIDDGSGTETAAWLQSFSERFSKAELHRSETASGYTRAANRGLRASRSDYVLLLNSDAIVTAGALPRLLGVGESDPRVGIIGPISNSATWQSVPRLSSNGDWATNPLPSTMSVETVAELVRSAGKDRVVRVPILNGFCLLVKRGLIDAVGLLDEEAFPSGYGEENDYCFRATDAGFDLAVAVSAFVFHAKSRSYSHERRRELAGKGGKALRKKHGRERIDRGVKVLKNQPVLRELRGTLRTRMPVQTRADGTPDDLKVLFLLPVRGGSGGAHSVVQEAAGMRRLGVDARVVVKQRDLAEYFVNYPNLPRAVFLPMKSVSHVDRLPKHYDIAVATIFTSVDMAVSYRALNPETVVAYYVQDYEPHFFEPGEPLRNVAKASYGAAERLFAKTDWIRETVKAHHSVSVSKVVPSIDHDVYFPQECQRRPMVAAMIRPSTPRRNAELTMRVLKRFSEQRPDVEIEVFGSWSLEMRRHRLNRDFGFQSHGVLRRERVADVLRRALVFVDFSVYQAFGRTGLESMACGAVPIVPQKGGTAEYLIDGENGWLVDTADEAACLAVLTQAFESNQLDQMRQRGLETASRFTVDAAARSELKLFKKWVDEARSRVEPETQIDTCSQPS